MPDRFIFYFTDANVGRRSANRAKDVALVQFFLKRIKDKGSMAPTFTPPNWPDDALRPDGNADENLFRHIEAFQLACGLGYADGVVSAATGRNSHTNIPPTIYTLNQMYLASYPQFFASIDKDPEFPAMLSEDIRSDILGL